METDLNYYNFTLIGTGISSLSTGRSPADEFYGSSRNPKGKKSYLSGSKKIKGMSYDQFLRFIFPERECLIILS
ncbi:hypothetical protein, partial [Parabacteroides johnsonii]|uniref:hypothetical protein n=1 Tax=Parabacteroides johnsonii TaxID=387661 RepID=UPI001C9E9953